MGKEHRKIGSGDFPLVAITVALVIFGIIMVFSASYYYSIDTTGTPYTFLFKDLVWAGTGFLIMIATMIVDYRRYRKWGPLLMIFAVGLLAIVPFVGQEINGATRWIAVGGLTIMPGEIAKICTIIFVAWFLSRKPKAVRNFLTGVLPLLLVGIVLGVLIMLQPNLSTAVTIIGIIFAMMFVAGIKLYQFIGILGLGVAGAIGFILRSGGYHLERVKNFLDPFKNMDDGGYQVAQGLLAMGSGGLFGLGLGNSIQKNLYLPEPQNDFILAIIGEELGFVAILILLAAYLFLIWRGIQISLRAPDTFGFLLGSGIVMMIGIQVMLNVAVVTSSIPPTGVTLPLVSYGGNALWLFMGSMGILINISRHGNGEYRLNRLRPEKIKEKEQ